MGDRALVIVTDGTEVSPIIYLHWAGNKVPALIGKLKDLMGDRTGDVSYAAARFIGVAHADQPDAISLGMWNTSIDDAKAVISQDENALEKLSHGDAGVVIIDCNDFTWKAYGGYLEKKGQEAA